MKGKWGAPAPRGAQIIDRYALEGKVHFWTGDVWPYFWSRCDFNLWPQNLISSSVSGTATNLQIWWNSCKHFVRHTSQNAYLTTSGLTETMTFLTLTSTQFIFVPKGTLYVNLVKFLQVGCTISCSQNTWTHTHTCIHGRTGIRSAHIHVSVTSFMT